MENRKSLKFVLAIVIIATAPGISSAYSTITHKALTQETIDAYENIYGNKLNSADEELAIVGSFNEDEHPRYLNHFYDPINQRGLRAGVLKGMLSKLWATDTVAQAGSYKFGNGIGYKDKLFTGADDYSWERAVYEYAHGSKERAMRTLGHVVHLVQDATVPAHVRNDAHSTGDPYEEYAKRFDRNTIRNIRMDALDVPKLTKLESYFNEAATFTNKNFLSKDTVFDGYKFPNRKNLLLERSVADGQNQYFGKTSVGKIVRVKRDKNWGNDTYTESYFIKDENSLILSENWQVLSTQAVRHGVGVIALFFSEVEQEKQTQALLYKNKSEEEVRRIARTIKTFGKAKKLYGSSLAAADVADLNGEEWQGAADAASAYGIDFPLVATLPIDAEDTYVENSKSVQDLPQPLPLVINNDPPAGGQPLSAEAPRGTTSPTPPTPEPAPIQDPVVEEPAPVVMQSAPASEPVQVSEPEPAPMSQPSPFDPGGYAYGGGGGSSSPAPTPDTEAPDISLSVTECTDSISASSCLLLPGDITINWSSTASDVDYYEIKIGSNATSTESAAGQATSTVSNAETVSITAIAYDEAGNSSATSTTVSANAAPLLITEVAWRGTDALATDEWVELYNNSGEEINLGDFTLSTAATSTTLSGALAAGSYYLVEAREEATDIASNHIKYFALSDSGETLELKHGSTVVDSTNYSVAINTSSAERYRLTSSWATNNGAVYNGQDANAAALTATPGERNSVSYEIELGGTLTADTTLTTSNSPYLITSSSFTIPSGKTLTIDEGVTVKVQSGSGARLDIEGTLNTSGTEANPVIFTSLHSTPAAGNWARLHFYSTASGALTHTKVLYAGSANMPIQTAVYVDSASPTFSNLTVRDSQYRALTLNSSSSQVSDGVFSSTGAEGVYIAGGSPTLQNSTIDSASTYGMYVNNAPNAQILSNAFNNNTTAAASILGAAPKFSGSTGSGNGYDRIELASGVLTGTSGTTTLYANTLPYAIVGTSEVPSGGTLTFESGTTVQATPSSKLDITGGAITFSGSSASDLVFEGVDGNQAAGAWYGIWLASSGSLNMSGFTLRHAGKKVGANGYALKISGATGTTTIANALIEDNDEKGVYITNGTAEITGSTIQNNDIYGVYLYNTQLTLDTITFGGHTGKDIYGTGGSSATCTDCGVYTEDVN